MKCHAKTMKKRVETSPKIPLLGYYHPLQNTEKEMKWNYFPYNN